MPLTSPPPSPSFPKRRERPRPAGFGHTDRAEVGERPGKRAVRRSVMRAWGRGSRVFGGNVGRSARFWPEVGKTGGKRCGSSDPGPGEERAGRSAKRRPAAGRGRRKHAVIARFRRFSLRKIFYRAFLRPHKIWCFSGPGSYNSEKIVRRNALRIRLGFGMIMARPLSAPRGERLHRRKHTARHTAVFHLPSPGICPEILLPDIP